MSLELTYIFALAAGFISFFLSSIFAYYFRLREPVDFEGFQLY